MMVLLLELLIAIPIKSYDNRRILSRQIPLPTRFYPGVMATTGTLSNKAFEEETSLLASSSSIPLPTSLAFMKGIAYRDFNHSEDEIGELDQDRLIYTEGPKEFTERRYRNPQTSAFNHTEITPILRGDSINTQNQNIRYV